jgi:hypothetical protein
MSDDDVTRLGDDILNNPCNPGDAYGGAGDPDWQAARAARPTPAADDGLISRLRQYADDEQNGVGSSRKKAMFLDAAIRDEIGADLNLAADRLAGLAEEYELKVNDLELRAARHGATQARREVMAYLRDRGQPATAMAIDKWCRWPDKPAPTEDVT